MPIEIKELHIKINVDNSNASSNQEVNRANRDEQLVALCVEKVMEILAKQKER